MDEQEKHTWQAPESALQTCEQFAPKLVPTLYAWNHDTKKRVPVAPLKLLNPHELTDEYNELIFKMQQAYCIVQCYWRYIDKHPEFEQTFPRRDVKRRYNMLLSNLEHRANNVEKRRVYVENTMRQSAQFRKTQSKTSRVEEIGDETIVPGN